jgi:hypothetical protein
MENLAQYIIDKYTGAINAPKAATSHKAARRELQAVLFALRAIGYNAVFVANLAALVKAL